MNKKENLEKKLISNRELLISLTTKKENLERTISNLEHKIANQEFSLKNLK